MKKYLEKSGKNEEEALAAALAELGLDRDDVSVEIVERAKSGFLGIGASPAVIRVEYEVPDEPVKKPEPVIEPEAQPKPQQAQRKPERRVSAPKAEPSVAPAAYEPKYVGQGIKEDVEKFISGLLERMGITAEIEISDRENGGLLVNLSGPGMGAVIGRRGETLDAIQHLTNYAVNRGSEKRCHISVDAESYRAKREESLVRLAEKMAAKVLKYRRSMALEPMNSYERHVIHAALQDFDGVTTSSIGTEPNRRVVISYARSSAQPDNRPRSREWS